MSCTVAHILLSIDQFVRNKNKEDGMLIDWDISIDLDSPDAEEDLKYRLVSSTIYP